MPRPGNKRGPVFFVYCRLLIILCAFLLVGSPAAVADDFQICLKYATFDPLVVEPSIPADLRTSPAPGQTERFLVQFDGPILDEWTQALASLGGEVISYIPNYAFLVKMTPEQAVSAHLLPHVRWVGAFHAAYKLDRALAAGAGSVRARVNVAKGGNAAAVRGEMESLGGIVRDNGGAADRSLAATIPAKSLRKIAQLTDVEWIEPEPEYRLFNDVARGILNVPTVWSNLSLYGSGEKVAVADTGLDTGNTSTLSADFAGRLFKTYSLGRKNSWSDTVGHGTHVCGSVLGNGSLSGSNPATHNYTSSFAGAAPEASLIMQSVANSSGSLTGIPSNLNNLFSPVYTDGARIHSDSWGSTSTGVYTTDSSNVDLFIWNNKDFTIVFAAGNDGIDANANGVVDLNSLGSPASAKNCIAVGASENLRSSGGYQFSYGTGWPSDYPADPVKSDLMSNNAGGMAAFSSRGPAADGRIKPDVVAPGTNIVSARSHASSAGTLWGVYNADYCYSGGTSMATPLVAGTAALVRQYYRTVRSVTSPTAALIKATLINGATDLYPGQYGTGAFLEQPTTRPNSVEGWGRIDLAYAIAPNAQRTMQFVDNTTGLSTNGSVAYTYPVIGNASPMRVTLVWTDYPALANASKALINDLDLTVTAPDLTIWHGNGTTDRTNNVEGVDIANPIPGTYTVRVSGYNVPSHGPQPFALVTTAAFGQPTYTITASAGAGGSINPSGAVSVDIGSNKTFIITANTGYIISDVVVDGVSQGAISSYTFVGVAANHTISAAFSPVTFTITASAGTGGSISPSGAVSVDYGANKTFTITPNSGYAILDVMVDGVSQGAITTYTFSNVTANHTISAAFSPVTFTITASAGTGGSISPNGAVSVDYGASKTFTITPNTGYAILDVIVDGASIGVVTTYTFNNVTANHTISAAFANNVANIAAVKAEPDGAPVKLARAETVIYAPKNSGGMRTTTFFYIGETKALGGLMVVDKNSDTLTIGNQVTSLAGFVRRPAGGEIYLELTADPTGSGNSPIAPIGMANKSVLHDSLVPTNSIVTWGKVKSVNGTTSFTMSDGFGMQVTVIVNGVALPTGFGATSYAIVTGVVNMARTVQAQTIRSVP